MTLRTAYFLDIDNLTGTGRASQWQVAEVLKAFELACGPTIHDLVFCAGTAMAAYYVKLAKPGYRVLVGRGKDGADLQLLSMADADVLCRQFQRVVLGSGDSIFYPLVTQLRSRGLAVELLKGKGHLSHLLYQSIRPSIQGSLSLITTLQLAA